eukprot:11203272-Lingulodinium_polyedra.AAC.1
MDLTFTPCDLRGEFVQAVPQGVSVSVCGDPFRPAWRELGAIDVAAGFGPRPRHARARPREARAATKAVVATAR